MANVIETLDNCQIELRQLKQCFDNCQCPTNAYIADCTTAIADIRTVIERLEAWRDNAALMLQLSEPRHDDRWRNERDNYQNLITLLKG